MRKEFGGFGKQESKTNHKRGYKNDILEIIYISAEDPTQINCDVQILLMVLVRLRISLPSIDFGSYFPDKFEYHPISFNHPTPPETHRNPQ